MKLHYLFSCIFLIRIGDSNEEYCLFGMYRLATYYYDRALPCECHAMGSYNSSCAQYDGQCACKPGVTGRQCDQCHLDYFNMTDAGCERE